eukprot:m.334785 g.334785  ORF g.334785 m.334785 type:complete len:92 (+) comp16074_c0_seq10:1097-1372(+)
MLRALQSASTPLSPMTSNTAQAKLAFRFINMSFTCGGKKKKGRDKLQRSLIDKKQCCNSTHRQPSRLGVFLMNEVEQHMSPSHPYLLLAAS